MDLIRHYHLQRDVAEWITRGWMALLGRRGKGVRKAQMLPKYRTRAPPKSIATPRHPDKPNKLTLARGWQPISHWFLESRRSAALLPHLTAKNIPRAIAPLCQRWKRRGTLHWIRLHLQRKACLARIIRKNLIALVWQLLTYALGRPLTLMAPAAILCSLQGCLLCQLCARQP